MNGIILKMENYQGVSPVKILNTHFRHAQEHEGLVYYSTDIMFNTYDSKRKKPKAKPDSVIFFLKVAGKDGLSNMFVQADLVSWASGKDAFIPGDASTFSPAAYVNEPKKTWLKLFNLRLVDTAYIDTLVFTGQNGQTRPLIDVISQPRVNRAYWDDAAISCEGDLINL